jgi:hypothetical protein
MRSEQRNLQAIRDIVTYGPTSHMRAPLWAFLFFVMTGILRPCHRSYCVRAVLANSDNSQKGRRNVGKSGFVVKNGSNRGALLKSGVLATGAAPVSGETPTGGSTELNCANLECSAPFSFRQGRLFRFYHYHPKRNAASMNQYSLKHFWLCKQCTEIYTLEYQEGMGVLIPLAAPSPRRG